MRAATLLAVGLFLCQLYGSYSLTCDTCKLKECKPVSPENCHAGVVLDTCGCCLVCAKGEGKPCGGHFKILGSCSKGFICVPNPNDVNPPEHAEGTCQFITSTKARTFLENEKAKSKTKLLGQIPASSLTSIQKDERRALSDSSNMQRDVSPTSFDSQSFVDNFKIAKPRKMYASPRQVRVRNMQPLAQPKKYFISYTPKLRVNPNSQRHHNRANNPSSKSFRSQPKWGKNAYRRQRFVRKHPKRNGRQLIYYN